MKSRLLSIVLSFACTLATVSAFGADALAPEDPVHNELRAVRDGLLAGMNKGDIEAQLAYLHPNVVVTWHSAEVSRGRDGVRKYLDRTLRGPDKVVDSYEAKLNVDELSILYGDTAIAFGSADEHFALAAGRALDLTGRWTATLVKTDGKWLVASLHVSDNLFDNPLLTRIKGLVPWVGAGSLLSGIIAGFIVGRRKQREP